MQKFTMKRHQLNALYLFIVAAGNQYYSVAADCDRSSGPAGGTHCIHLPRYNGYQWGTCRTDTYIRTTSKGKHQCEDRSRVYCYYQCMLDEYHKNYGNVFPYCACSLNSTQPTESVKLPASCYSPDGTDCSWYRGCLNKAYPDCEKSDDDYAIKYAQTFCELYNKNYEGFSSQGKQWINAVRKCLQVELVPMLDKRRSKTCKELKSRAFDSHTPCYLNPDSSSPSYCDLSWGDRLGVFWTIKSAFVQSFVPSVSGMWGVFWGECKKKSTTGLVISTKDKIEKAVRSVDATNILQERIKAWLQNPNPVPIQLDMFIKDDDWTKLSKRGKRSVTEDDEELARSYIAGKIADAVALDQHWKENGVAWFAYANNETLQDADGNFTSIRLLVADRFKYDLTENSTSPSKQHVNLTIALVDLSVAVLNGSQNLKVNGKSIKIAKMNGCLNWNCTVHAFNVTSLKLYERNEKTEQSPSQSTLGTKQPPSQGTMGTKPPNLAKQCVAFYLRTLLFFMITFLCIT